MRNAVSKLLFSFAFAVLVAFILTGCDSISDATWEYFNQGTNLAYKRCIEENKDVGLDDDVVRKLCTERHQHLVSLKYEGRAGYQYNAGYCTFEGYIENKSKDIIITSFLVNITHQKNRNKQGQVITESKLVEDLWVEPGTTRSFTLYDLEFKPTIEQVRNDGQSGYTWSASQMKGINVKLK